MVHCKYYEFVTIHLVYETRKSKHGIVSWIKSRPSEAPAQIFTWYTYAYQTETESTPPGSCIRYKEWRITTSDESLFTFRKFRYDQCCVFLGAEMCYWIFFQNFPGNQMFESGHPLEFPHCGCCIPHQYDRILRNIIDNYGE